MTDALNSRWAAALTGLLFAATLLSARTPEDLDPNPLGLNANNPYGRLTSEVVTPHIPWARPSVGGPVRALVMAPCWSQRETVELAERLDLAYSAWMSESFTSVASPGGASPEDQFFRAPVQAVFRSLDQSLARASDVIVIGRLDWLMLPTESRFEILRQVAGGTGLVYIDPPATNRELAIVFDKHPTNDNGYILAGVPYQEFPRWQTVTPAKLLAFSDFGRGRVVVLRYPGPAKQTWLQGAALTPIWVSPFTWVHGGQQWPAGTEPLLNEWPWYDYYLSLVARAVLWAAHREPAIRLADLQVLGAAQAGRTGTVVIARAPADRAWPKPLWAQLSVRDSDGREVARAGARLPARAAEYRASLPPLPAGKYLASVWLRQQADGPVFDWGTVAVTVQAAARVREIRLDTALHNAGEPLAGEVMIEGALPGDRLRLELWDNLERQIATWRGPATPATAFAFDPWQPLVTVHELRAFLERDGQDVCRAQRSVPVRCSFAPDRFYFISWGNNYSDPVTHLLLRQMEHDGIDAMFASAGYVQWKIFDFPMPTNPAPALAVQEIAQNVAMANLRLVSSHDRYGVFDADDRHRACLRGRLYSVSDPAMLRRTGELQQFCAEITGPYGPLAYTHGDESLFSNDPDVDWADVTLQKLRDYLREQYGTLAALNHEWETNFPAWEAVMPLTLKEARQTGRYAPWLDHRRFSQRAFLEFYANTQDYIRRADPGVRTGSDGSGAIGPCNNGMDLYEWSRRLGLLQCYVGIEEDLYRSFGPRESLRGAYFGSYGDWQVGPSNSRYAEFYPWHCLFSGMNSVWFWTMGFCYGTAGGVSGYTPGLAPLPYFRTARDTIREIKDGADRLLLNCRRENSGVAVLYSPVSAIADALMAPDPATQSQAYRRSLELVHYAIKDIGLQYDFVASPQVEAGRLVDDGFRVLFLPQAWALSPREAERIREFVRQGGLVIADIIPGILDQHGRRQPEPLLADLFPTNAPSATIAQGKGHALLLGPNWALPASAGSSGDVISQRASWKERSPAVRSLANKLESLAAVVPAVSIEPVGNTPAVPPEDVVCFADGELRYVGAVRDYWLNDEADYSISLRLPARGHVYDVRAGKYLGLKDHLPVALAAHPYLWAISPYRVTGVRLAAPTRSRRGETIKIRARALAASPRMQRHVFRVEWTGPAGLPLPHYGRVVSGPDGTAELEHRWALNDPPGDYRLTVRDVMSGETAQTTVRVTR